MRGLYTLPAAQPGGGLGGERVNSDGGVRRLALGLEWLASTLRIRCQDKTSGLQSAD